LHEGKGGGGGGYYGGKSYSGVGAAGGGGGSSYIGGSGVTDAVTYAAGEGGFLGRSEGGLARVVFDLGQR
jgi:hypothetical protein